MFTFSVAKLQKFPFRAERFRRNRVWQLQKRPCKFKQSIEISIPRFCSFLFEQWKKNFAHLFCVIISCGLFLVLLRCHYSTPDTMINDYLRYNKANVLTDFWWMNEIVFCSSYLCKFQHFENIRNNKSSQFNCTWELVQCCINKRSLG